MAIVAKHGQTKDNATSACAGRFLVPGLGEYASFSSSGWPDAIADEMTTAANGRRDDGKM